MHPHSLTSKKHGDIHIQSIHPHSQLASRQKDKDIQAFSCRPDPAGQTRSQVPVAIWIRNVITNQREISCCFSRRTHLITISITDCYGAQSQLCVLAVGSDTPSRFLIYNALCVCGAWVATHIPQLGNVHQARTVEHRCTLSVFTDRTFLVNRPSHIVFDPCWVSAALEPTCEAIDPFPWRTRPWAPAPFSIE